jgi:hypothetical protein
MGIAEDSLRGTGDGIFQHIGTTWASDQQQADRNNSSKAEGCKSILPTTVSLLLQALRSRRRSHVVEVVSGDKNEFTGSCFGNGLGTLHDEIAVADEECVVAARNFAVFFDTFPGFDFDFLKPGVGDL